jgi:FKBP-type peptidyl-prolyl cis-trans isomerase FklB
MKPVHLLALLLAFTVSLEAQAQKKKEKEKDKFKLKTQSDSVSYSLGVLLGESMKKGDIGDIQFEAFSHAFERQMNEDSVLIGREAADTYMRSYMMARFEAKKKQNLEEGKKFLEANKTKPGVITLPSGLQYKVIKDGQGESPKSTDKVRVHYHGTLINGKVFDSSVERGEPIELGVDRVIKGWTEALQLMKPGAKWVLYIPSDLAYGENPMPNGPIGPNEALIFEVELLDVIKNDTPAIQPENNENNLQEQVAPAN